MHPGGMRSAMDLFDFEKSANLKHPNEQFEDEILEDFNNDIVTCRWGQVTVGFESL